MICRLGDKSAKKNTLEYLRKNEVVIYPCDTIYGFIGRYVSTKQEIERLKGRGEGHPFLVLSTKRLIKGISDFEIPKSIEEFWPGPLTVIIPSKREGSIAVRVPDDPVLLDLIDELDSPVYSTSVNKTGEPPMNGIMEIIRRYKGKVGLIVDGGDLESGKPSTIVDLTTKPYSVVRQGELCLNPEILSGL